MSKKPKGREVEVTTSEWDPDDPDLQGPADDVLVSVGELEGDDLPEPHETDLSDTGVHLPEVD